MRSVATQRENQAALPPETDAAEPTGPISGAKLKREIARLYQIHNPHPDSDKMAKLMAKYAGREVELLVKIKRKYNVPVTDQEERMLAALQAAAGETASDGVAERREQFMRSKQTVVALITELNAALASGR